MRVDVNPELLVWARERSGIASDDLARRFPKLEEWERGDRSPTLKQLESFANATHAPVGFLFLQEPPEEQVPIPDYRTIGDAGIRRPSPDLLDTIFQCQQRQEWYRDFAQVTREDPVALIATLTAATPVVEGAATMRGALRFGVGERGSSWTNALRLLIERAEDLGVLVMVNGVVGSNTHRKLDPREFRGFALVDSLAPLVFVNGADTKAAQIFTLAHELAHLWLGESALSDADLTSTPTVAAERWCNQVAAEFLVPLARITAEFNHEQPLQDELERWLSSLDRSLYASRGSASSRTMIRFPSIRRTASQGMTVYGFLSRMPRCSSKARRPMQRPVTRRLVAESTPRRS